MAETVENIQVLICTGTGGYASGAQSVIDAFEAEFAKQGVEALRWSCRLAMPEPDCF